MWHVNVFLPLLSDCYDKVVINVVEKNNSSKDKLCYNEDKVCGLNLHFDAKSYIEGLDIISNIVTDQ
jgi:hypothetical protein